MKLRTWAAVAFAVYVAAIVLSNWLITHVVIPLYRDRPGEAARRNGT